MWVGTQLGLHRFDGANFDVFDSDLDNKKWIPDSEIRDIVEDNYGNILISTYDGHLLKWNDELQVFDLVSQFPPDENNSALLVVKSKNSGVWVLSKKGLFLYDSNFQTSSERLSAIELEETIGRPETILEEKSGDLLLSGKFGLVNLLVKDNTLVTLDAMASSNLEGTYVTATIARDNGRIIVGTNTGQIGELDLAEKDIQFTAELNENGRNIVWKFLDYNGQLIIATDRGLYSANLELSQISNLTNKGEGLSSSDVYSILADGAHIWVGTSNGLDILSFTPIELFNFRNSLVFDDVLGFEEDTLGRLWVGTYSGLYQFQKDTRTHVKLSLPPSSSPLADYRITAMTMQGRYLWLGFYQGGVQKLDLRSGEVSTPEVDIAKDIYVMDIIATNSNRYVWVATYNHGLIRLDQQESNYYFTNGNILDKRVTQLFSSSSGELIVSTSKNSYSFNETTSRFTALNFDFGLDGRRPSIFSMKEDADGNIWIGTDSQGLFLWTAERRGNSVFSLESVGSGAHLGNLTIYGIEIDPKGNLWCSTQNGIFALNSNGEFLRKFGVTDGLQGKDFGFGSAFTTSSGDILFGGANGYNRINVNEVSLEASHSSVRLTGVTYPGKRDMILGADSNLSSLQLTHSDRFITFQFSVLDLIHPEKNQFRYMLENFDTEWIDNGNRNTATYTNLAPGDYVFRVQGANSAGVWNYDGLSLDLHVLPPLWKTWWAYCLYSLAFLIATWGAHRIYYSYVIHRHSIELAKEMFDAENRADDDMQEQIELQDELVQSAYSHNLANLSLVRECLSQRVDSNTDAAVIEYKDENLKRIAALAGLEDCLFYRAGGPVADLHKYTDSVITMLLPDAKVSPESIITINEIPSRLLPGEVASPLAIVLYELLENTIEHAFEEGSLANYLHITLESRKSESSHRREFQLCVRDSGGGFTATIEELLELNSGLSIVKAITDRLGGELEVSTSSGTKVTVTIPEPAPWNPPTNSYII